jgi:hypothetical protein
MGIVVVLIVAGLAGGAVYWFSLRTLPEEERTEGPGETSAVRRWLRGWAVGGATRAADSSRSDEIGVVPPTPSPTTTIVAEGSPATRPKAAAVETADRPWRGRLRRPTPAPPPVPGGPAEQLPSPGAASRTTLGPERFDQWEDDGVLYVPVMADHPSTHSRVLGLLGIVALVAVSGALLALGVWQTIHVVTKLLSHVAGS